MRRLAFPKIRTVAQVFLLGSLGLIPPGCAPAETGAGAGGNSPASGGATVPGTGGQGTGGAVGTGGSGTGGSGTGTGGSATGTGGSGSGTGGSGSGSGGSGSGGRGSGGASTGGSGSGGRGTGGTGTGGRGTGGSGSGGSATGGSGAGGASGRFSFFMASQAGLGRLAGNANGFGGDLRFGKADGLTGADDICRQLAETSMPGNGKTWRAFLSVTRGPAGTPVNAIDRIGEGPWYDRIGRIVAMNKAALLSSTGRPQGADPAILNDLPNEDGIPNHNPGSGIIDNHNVLTGSTAQGNIDAQGLTATCQDWTSAVSSGGRPRCGVSWPRASLINWISVLNEGGCAPGATPGNGAQSGPQGTVGALGGYGGIYCMALTP